MGSLTRRRSSRDSEPEEEREERTTTRRRRRPSDDMPREERNTPDPDDEDEDRPRRRRRKTSGDGESSGRKASRGWGSYEQKRAKTSSRADEFKAPDNEPVLIKFLDEEPFDNYNQHWVDDVPSGTKKSYMCVDDEYFEAEGYDECPLCAIGEGASTHSLFNVLDLTNPDKPEVKVWDASPTVADILKRAAKQKKTTPLNREDLYFEVTKVKEKRKTTWNIDAVKARDLQEDYEMEPLDSEELETFAEKRHTTRKGVVYVDTYESLEEVVDLID